MHWSLHRADPLSALTLQCCIYVKAYRETLATLQALVLFTGQLLIPRCQLQIDSSCKHQSRLSLLLNSDRRRTDFLLPQAIFEHFAEDSGNTWSNTLQFQLSSLEGPVGLALFHLLNGHKHIKPWREVQHSSKTLKCCMQRIYLYLIFLVADRNTFSMLVYVIIL